MPSYYPNYPMQPNVYPTQIGVMQTPVPTPQVQNGGFVSVPSEDIVNTYPVAPGNCVTFKIEGKPIVMEKYMGFSQLESPKIERYRLVKEDAAETHQEAHNGLLDDEPITSTIEELKGEIEAIWSEIDGIKSHPVSANKKTVAKRKEENDDE